VKQIVELDWNNPRSISNLYKHLSEFVEQIGRFFAPLKAGLGIPRGASNLLNINIMKNI
jgi:hypothetical protein